MISSYFYPKGYGGNAVYELCRNLVKLGLDVNVITSCVKGEPKHQIIDGVEVHRIPTSFLKFFNIEYPLSPTAIHNVLNVMKKSDVDLIHTQFLFSPLSLCAGFFDTVNLASVPLVATSHGLTKGYPSPFVETASKFLSFFSKNLVMKRASAVATVSMREYNYLKDDFHDKVHFIPNGVDTLTFKPLPQKGEDLRVQLGIDKNDILVLYFAHLRATKGILTLINSMDYVIKANPNVKFLIVGTGPLAVDVEKSLLRHEGHAYSLIEYVPTDFLPSLYNACDVYVLPSFVEGMPLALMEAMACGKPVVATNVGDIPFLVKDYENGIVISPGNAKELAKNIIYLTENDALMKSMGKANLKKMTGYDWEHVSKKYHSLYQKILNAQ